MSRIAVLRANGLGDLVFALPALAALRRAYPSAEIVFLGCGWHVPFLTGRPGPWDRVVAVPPSGGVNQSDGDPAGDAEMDSFFAAMRAERFDLALQLHGGGVHSNPFVRRLGARLTAGLATPDALALDLTVPYVYWQVEILRFLEVVACVGAEPVGFEPELEVIDSERDEAARLLPCAAAPLVVVHPGAGDPRRRWPPAAFAAVADRVAEAGARVVAIGTECDRPLVQRMLEAMRRPAVDLCGRLSLGALAGLLAGARLVIGNDSGPLHLGRAVGAATVGIFWCGNLVTAAPMTRTRHRPVPSWRIHCPVCGRDTITDPCGHRVSFVEDAPVDEVVAAALELLLDRCCADAHGHAAA